MVEMAPAADADTFKRSFSGDTFNTAWYARKALPRDWQVDYLTAVGDDTLSSEMVSFISNAGIGTEHILRLIDQSVGLYMISLHEGERSFSYWRGQSAAKKMADDADHLNRALEGAQLIYLSGITLAVIDNVARSRVFNALETARRAGAIVAFDPNLRLRLWPDTVAMRETIMAAAAHADIILPSHDDEATFFGDASPIATATRYGMLGSSLVVVKNGDGEMLTWDKGAIATYKPAKVTEVVDTTAAGDSFNAGFLASYLTGNSLAKSVDKGSNLAAKVISGRGALVS